MSSYFLCSIQFFLLCIIFKTIVHADEVHVKCRLDHYPRFTDQKRLQFENNLVPWDVPFDTYNPMEFNAPVLADSPPWADPVLEDPNFQPSWNQLDGKVNRISYNGIYKIEETKFDKEANKTIIGRPLNPQGRTGLKGRGLLGRWGPNHAADSIITRWKLGEDGHIVNDTKTNKKILQFISIFRSDDREWAIPGGMVDPGEDVAVTLIREFAEEVLGVPEGNSEKPKLSTEMENFFHNNKVVIYKGYVDDPRNTDNVWMETVAANFHDEDGKTVSKISFKVNKEAKKIQWLDLSRDLKLFASHAKFLELVAKQHNAHW